MNNARRNHQWLALVLVLLAAPIAARSAGISVDAGLTPAEDRWIVRAQARYVSRGDDLNGMTNVVFPFVLAYGARSDLSIFVRQMLVRRERTTSGSSTTESGLADTFLFAKYRLYRVNTARLTFGVAPTLGVELPSGHNAFTSDTWDLRGGAYASLRTHTWSSDVNLSYTWNDAFGLENRAPGNEMSADLAVAYQILLTETGAMTVAPVLEVSFLKAWPRQQDGADVSGTDETVVYVSPGVKLATAMVIVEGLVRIPVHDDVSSRTMEQNTGGLLGMRLLF